MPPKKKTKVAGLSTDVAAVTIDALDDVLANIFGWLRLQEIMGKRCVCKKWKKAVKQTIVPPNKFSNPTFGDFYVDSVDNYNAMAVMTRALPNLQQITIGGLGYGHKWNDGEDPDDGEDSDEEMAAITDDRIVHDIEIISNFTQLRILTFWHGAQLNGRYPALFNFPLLQKLSIVDCTFLKWDLEMLVGTPFLKELECTNNDRLTGNINNLRVLKDTLERVVIDGCSRVEGNFMDFADFPHLKELDLGDTAVTGDIRDIGDNDFPSLEELDLPKTVYGGRGYELQRISDAPDLVRAVYLLEKQRPTLLDLRMTSFHAMDPPQWYAKLSEDSPDWYESVEEDNHFWREEPPFSIRFVQAGSRIGYRWASRRQLHGCLCFIKPCEVNWLDPEPDRENIGYKEYIEEKRELDRMVELCKGFYEPPTEEEYTRLIEDIGGVASRTRARRLTGGRI